MPGARRAHASEKKGKRVGHYLMASTIGSGNFSKVKRGIHVLSGESCAIKVIEKSQLIRERMEEQLKREIALMTSMRHPNVIQMMEVLQSHNHIYVVMELVDGGELFDKIVASKRFNEERARFYFQQLITGVYYCHARGVAHRDLKPENLLLDKNDVLKISDFGLSNLQHGDGVSDGALLQTVCGTPNYVAPEVLRERGYDGRKADIWSCGVILFVMLAGYLPFDDDNINALFTKIERGEFTCPRFLPTKARELIHLMLKVEPKERATLDDIIRHPWFIVGFDPSGLAGGESKLSGAEASRVMHELK